MVSQTFEGTWEEIQQLQSQFAGRRVRLTVLDNTSNVPRQAAGNSSGAPIPSAQSNLDKINKAMQSFPAGTTLAEAMKDYVGSVKSETQHNDSERVEEIWGQHVLEKHSKGQERPT